MDASVARQLGSICSELKQVHGVSWVKKLDGARAQVGKSWKLPNFGWALPLCDFAWQGPSPGSYLLSMRLLWLYIWSRQAQLDRFPWHGCFAFLRRLLYWHWGRRCQITA